jgi:hypothetical protein
VDGATRASSSSSSANDVGGSRDEGGGGEASSSSSSSSSPSSSFLASSIDLRTTGTAGLGKRLTINGRLMLNYQAAREFVWHLYLVSEVGGGGDSCVCGHVAST